MRTVPVPDAGLPALTRSVTAAIACILELDSPDALPAPPATHPEPWTLWRNWLAERGLGLVPILDPVNFGWPGPWIALLRSAGGERHAAVAFGSPPGLVWDPLATDLAFETVEAGYLIAPADVAHPPPGPARPPPPGPESPPPGDPAHATPPGPADQTPAQPAHPPARQRGRIEALALAGRAEAGMTLVQQATLHAGRGLEGDRYHEARGTFSNPHAAGLDLTLIEAEALDDVVLPAGRLAPAEARRNVVTRGIDLDALVGRRFLLGEVACIGRRLCEPCAHLQRLTLPGTLRGLVHRGGLRADVLTDGVIRVGDPIEPADLA